MKDTKMNLSLLTKWLSKNKILVALFLAVMVGTFLRAYSFHDWLLFETDQARDTKLVADVISEKQSWPLLGPTMRASGDDQATLYRVGPIYYYFQIISVKIFGNLPVSQAYPDLLFSVLLIPLFFYFLKRYFSDKVALCLTAFSAVSFFLIKYGRFAWNPNSIPFFVILFLLSAYEFLLNQEKVKLFWIILLGFSMGIVVQLHATMLVLMALFFSGFALLLIKKNKKTVSKLLLTIAIAILLNIPQFFSELENNFANTKALLFSPVKSGQIEKKSLAKVFADNISCHLEANSYMFSSLGSESCNFSFVKAFENNKSGKSFRKSVSWNTLAIVFAFSALGYAMFIYLLKSEKDDEKRHFLMLCGAFALCYFIVLMPVIGADYKEFRYFVPIFFVPYLFAGFILEFLNRKKVYRNYSAIAAIIVIVMGANFYSISNLAKILLKHEGNNGHTVYLGEVENMINYMKGESETGNKNKYIMTDSLYSGNIYLPAAFVAEKEGINMIKVPSPDNVPNGANLFYVTKNDSDDKQQKIEGLEVENVKVDGIIKIYKLKKD